MAKVINSLISSVDRSSAPNFQQIHQRRRPEKWTSCWCYRKGESLNHQVVEYISVWLTVTALHRDAASLAKKKHTVWITQNKFLMARQKGTDNQPLRMCCLTYKKQWLKPTVTSLLSSSVSNTSYSFFQVSRSSISCQWIQHWLFTLSVYSWQRQHDPTHRCDFTTTYKERERERETIYAYLLCSFQWKYNK